MVWYRALASGGSPTNSDAGEQVKDVMLRKPSKRARRRVSSRWKWAGKLFLGRVKAAGRAGRWSDSSRKARKAFRPQKSLKPSRTMQRDIQLNLLDIAACDDESGDPPS
jgi:hypothetical protein